MKRSVFLAAYLLWSISLGNCHAATPIVNNSLLTTIDPIFNRLHDEFNISHIIFFSELVEQFLSETFTTQSSQKRVSLDAMVELENSLSDTDKKKLKKFTERCVENFVRTTQKERVLELFSALQEHYRNLVIAWAEQNNYSSSPFVQFSMHWRLLGSELTVMNDTVHTLQEYQLFLRHLHTFLEDLVVSLPHAYAEYQECAKTNNSSLSK